MQTLYDVIGVLITAPRAEIEAACLSLGEHHKLDSDAGNTVARERLAEIERAYETLIDNGRRNLYDQSVGIVGGRFTNAADATSEGEPHSHYELLGVSPHVTQEEISVVCRALRAKHKSHETCLNIAAYEQLSEIERACETLTDSTSRANYDSEFFGRSQSKVIRENAQTSAHEPKSRKHRLFLAIALLASVFACVLGIIVFVQRPVSTQATTSQSANTSLPYIKSECSTNGYGQVTCTFHNMGDVRGTACVSVVVTNHFLPGNLSSKIRGGPVCSGVIEPRDVRQIQQFVRFVTETGLPQTPSEFCTYGSRSWPQGCTMTTENRK